MAEMLCRNPGIFELFVLTIRGGQCISRFSLGLCVSSNVDYVWKYQLSSSKGLSKDFVVIV